MLSVTVRSCLESLRPLGYDNCEIVIVDNSDQHIYELLPSVLPKGYCKEGLIKIYRQNYPCLFSARERAAEESTGKYIFCIDSHMVVGRNTISDLVSFMDRRSMDRRSMIGFAHAPICWIHQHERTAKHDRDMSVNELGNWNQQYDHERTITWKGMPWICKREWFLDKDHGLGGYGALAKHKISWGGGDMHIGIKTWLLGYENWAVPTNPCFHIGPFPKIDKGKDPNVSFTGPGKYRLYSTSGRYPHTFGFLVSCYVLGGKPMMKRNEGAIAKRFGRFIDVKKWKDEAIRLGQEEREWLINLQRISFDDLLVKKPWNQHHE